MGNKMASEDAMPSTETESYWIEAENKELYEAQQEHIFGKWLLFVPVEKVDDVWREVWAGVESGTIGAPKAKVATAKDNPNSNNKKQKVICVYTTEEEMRAVGKRLLANVPWLHSTRPPIRYKTDQATREGQYANRGSKKTTILAMHWTPETITEPTFE